LVVKIAKPTEKSGLELHQNSEDLPGILVPVKLAMPASAGLTGKALMKPAVPRVEEAYGPLREKLALLLTAPQYIRSRTG
jgi:hypothetical protein